MTESAALPMLCSCATAVTETKQVYMRTVMIFLFVKRSLSVVVEFYVVLYELVRYETSTLYELSWLRWGI